MQYEARHPDSHGKPVTRRDFLSRGMIAYSTFAFGPSLLGMIASQATAQAADGAVLAPFLVFDLSGGAALPGNFLVGGRGGPEDLLPSYGRLGWNPRQTKLDKRFGLPMAGTSGGSTDPVSKILQGMLMTMSAEAQARLRFGSICHQSQDDSSNNTHSAIVWASKAGNKGTRIAKALGTSTSSGGANSQVPEAIDQLRPVRIANINALAEATGFASVAPELGRKTLAQMFEAMTKMGSSQLERLATQSNAQQLSALANAGYASNLKTLNDTAGTDPRADDIFRAVYQINANTNPESMNAVIAGITMNAIKGGSGPGAIELGGYDYHDNSQTTGDAKDLDAGQWIGRAVEAAHRLQKPLMFQILTDGGIFSVDGSRNWSGDAPDKSLTLIGYYDPKGPVSYYKNRMQLGHYTAGQGASDETSVGADTSKVAAAVIANYLSVSGKPELFSKVVPSSIYGGSIEDLLIFG